MSQFTKWAAEMDRAASAVEAESDGSVQVLAIIDGNRAIAEVLRSADAALREIAGVLDSDPSAGYRIAKIRAIVERAVGEQP